MKALFLNGSPRKNFNTAQMLQKAIDGAKEAGAETELINLFDYEFTGCRSCFTCKIKNSKTNGVCAIRDSIRPVIEKAQEADVIIIGSPVYFGYPTGQVRSLVERLLFPLDTYLFDDQGNQFKTEPEQLYVCNTLHWKNPERYKFPMDWYTDKSKYHDEQYSSDRRSCHAAGVRLANKVS